MNISGAQHSLLQWYNQNKRDFPWRANRDAYRIWISETMLQQTTTTAVIPYYERFMERFPTLQSLSEAQSSTVMEAWAGLGYYSRARNLHKAAQALWAAGGFPRSYIKLIELPGFGPYTARAVSSLAFDESVGVVDGNVIRVLSRFYGEEWDWWQGKVRQHIQSLADLWVQNVSSYEMNQALMELGRTMCTPKQATCLLCPLRQTCQAFKTARVLSLPKPKPRRMREIWVWEPWVQNRSDQIRLERNQDIPFLQGHWILPGAARRVQNKPNKYDYKHTITHHDIYVTLHSQTANPKESRESKWVALKEIRQHAPTSLVDKALGLWNKRQSVDFTSDLQTGRQNQAGRASRSDRPKRNRARSNR